MRFPAQRAPATPMILDLWLGSDQNSKITSMAAGRGRSLRCAGGGAQHRDGEQAAGPVAGLDAEVEDRL